MYRKIEVLANIAIIVVALLLGVVLVKRYILSPSDAQKKNAISAAIPIGAKIHLDNIDWGKYRRTLLIVVASGCHFCSESAPFYQRLAQQMAGKSNIQMIAVLPEPPDEGQKYLRQLGVPIKDVVQASLSSIEVRGTPTLVLVSDQGVVLDSWIGKLPVDKETEVVSKFFCDDCGA